MITPPNDLPRARQIRDIKMLVIFSSFEFKARCATIVTLFTTNIKNNNLIGFKPTLYFYCANYVPTPSDYYLFFMSNQQYKRDLLPTYGLYLKIYCLWNRTSPSDLNRLCTIHYTITIYLSGE